MNWQFCQTGSGVIGADSLLASGRVFQPAYPLAYPLAENSFVKTCEYAPRRNRLPRGSGQDKKLRFQEERVYSGYATASEE